MGSYVLGILVAAGIVVGLYFTVEGSNGVASRIPQEQLKSSSPEQLRKLATTMNPNRIEAILRLGDNPGELEKTLPVICQYLMSKDEMSRIAAESAMGKIGKDAIPFVRELFSTGEKGEAQVACSAIKSIGEDCEEFIPKLNDYLLSDETWERKCAVYALQGLPNNQVLQCMEGLINCIKDPEDFNVQCMACLVIEPMGIDALEAEEALLWLLENGNVSARSRAAMCLGAIGPTASDVDIAKLLGERLDKAQLATEIQRIIIGLAHLGPEASASLPKIKEICEKHRDASVQASGAFAIWRIGGEDSGAFEIFKKQIKDAESSVDAIALVGRMGKSGLPLLDDITKLFDSRFEVVRESAVITVGELGPAAIGAKEKLQKMLKDPDALVRNAAEKAIERISFKEKPADGGK